MGMIGTFSRFHSPNFPVVFPPWAIYAAVTNLTGKHEFALNLMLDETKQVIVNINGNFNVEDAFDVTELCFTVGNAVFPAPNKYQLTFHVDGETIGSRILVLDKVQIGG